MNTKLEGSRLKPRNVPMKSTGGESEITSPEAVVVVHATDTPKGLHLVVRKDEPDDKSPYPGEFASTGFKPA